MLDEITQVIATKVAEALGPTLWVAQKGSALGRNRHIAAVRRRVIDGKPGAVIAGKRYLLSPSALQEELRERLLAPRAKGVAKTTPDPAPMSVYDQLMGDIRRMRGS